MLVTKENSSLSKLSERAFSKLREDSPEVITLEYRSYLEQVEALETPARKRVCSQDIDDSPDYVEDIEAKSVRFIQLTKKRLATPVSVTPPSQYIATNVNDPDYTARFEQMMRNRKMAILGDAAAEIEISKMDAMSVEDVSRYIVNKEVEDNRERALKLQSIRNSLVVEAIERQNLIPPIMVNLADEIEETEEDRDERSIRNLFNPLARVGSSHPMVVRREDILIPSDEPPPLPRVNAERAIEAVAQNVEVPRIQMILNEVVRNRT
jgi:hypothetical protein